MPLSSELLSDLTTLFNTDEFAVSATYTPAGGSPATIKGIFGVPFIQTDPAGVDFANSDPVFTCKTSDVSTAKSGDTIVISSVTYKLTKIVPDGSGVTVLELSKDS